MFTAMKNAMQKVAPYAAFVVSTTTATYVGAEREKENQKVKQMEGHTCAMYRVPSGAGGFVEMEVCRAPSKATNQPK